MVSEEVAITRREIYRMSLRWKQVLALSFLGVALWAMVTYRIHAHPERLLDGTRTLFGFLTAPLGGVVSVWLCKVVGRLNRQQLLTGVSVVGAVAMMLDGVVLGWFPNMYGMNEKALRLGAAGLLWGYGVAFGVAVIWIGLAQPIEPSMELVEK